jgi:uncharacterized membrane protein
MPATLLPILLPFHLLFVGIWLGCILTEALFERALLGKGRVQKVILAVLHKRVDMFIELPALLMVLLTGCLLLKHGHGGSLLHYKIGFGLLAIAANLVCVWLVMRRANAAMAQDWEQFDRLDRIQHMVGAVVLLGMLLALGIGFYLFVRGYAG